jgi:hypothetical protein
MIKVGRLLEASSSSTVCDRLTQHGIWVILTRDGSPVAIPISTCLYWEKSFNFVVECRSALVGILYEKLLRSATAEAHDLGKVRCGHYCFDARADEISNIGWVRHQRERGCGKGVLFS